MRRKFSESHSCKFDLYFYPFDSQVCELVFELRDKTEDFIHFERDVEPIVYRGTTSFRLKSVVPSAAMVP